MPLFNDTQLQGFGNLLEKMAFKDDCQISRETTVDSDYGRKEIPVVIAEVKAMRKKPRPELLQLYADRLGSLSSWQISLPLGTDVQEGDMLTIGSDEMEVQILLKESWAVSCDVLASVNK